MREVTERPILFSGEMVRAILNERKTQTRRVVKPQPEGAADVRGMVRFKEYAWFPGASMPDVVRHCPYGKPGDRLWVRETFHVLDMRPDVTATPSGMLPLGDCPISVTYRATDTHEEKLIPREEWRPHMDNDVMNWRPAIFMPRWASRLALEITDVRVERLQDISDPDAKAEGVEFNKRAGYWKSYGMPGTSYCTTDARSSYATLWESINGEKSWLLNPWVWVVSFKRVDGEPRIHGGETISVLSEQSPPKEEETFLETGKQ